MEDSTEAKIREMLAEAWELRGSSPETAHKVATEALELSLSVEDNRGIAESSLIIGNCFIAFGQYEKAREYLNAANNTATGLNDKKLKVSILLALGKFHKIKGELALALQYYTDALSLTTSSANDAQTGGALMNLGSLWVRLGDYPKALESLREALNLRIRAGDPWEIATALNNIGILLADMGDLEQAHSYYGRSLELRESLNDKRGTANVLNNLAVLLGHEGAHDRALEKYQQALFLYEEAQFSEGIAAAHCNIADSCIRLKRFKDAITHLHTAERLYRELGNTSALAVCLTNRASALVLSGNERETKKILREILPLISGIKERTYLVEIHKELGNTYFELKDHEQAYYHSHVYYSIDKEIFNEESDRRLKNLQIIHQVEQMKKDKEKAEKERELEHIRAEKLHQDNEHKSKELTALALNLIHKNNLIENISDHVESALKDLDAARTRLLKNVLKELRGAYIEELDWKKFEEQFQQVHGEFIQKLLQRYPALSPMEVRVCALLRLQLSNKQIATLLNVESRTVEFHRVNIRKKLQLNKVDNLLSILLAL